MPGWLSQLKEESIVLPSLPGYVPEPSFSPEPFLPFFSFPSTPLFIPLGLAAFTPFQALMFCESPWTFSLSMKWK